MRTAAFALALIVAAAGTAGADPAPPAKKKPATAPAPAPSALDFTPVLRPPQPPPPGRIDLFPPAVLGDPGLSLRGGVAEKRPLSFGGGWKTDAAVVGAMAAGFAALIGLCSGGRCMLPEWSADPGPGVSPSIGPQPDERIRDVR